MDPLSALSVAGTIVQFVDYGTRLLSRANELYNSSVGTLCPNNELELVTTDLRGLITKLRQSFNSESDIDPLSAEAQHQKSFEKLCDEATKLAKELVERLDKLKVKDGKHRLWRSLQHAIESAWSEREVTDLKNRLLSFKEALETRVLFSIPLVVNFRNCATPVKTKLLLVRLRLGIPQKLRSEGYQLNQLRFYT